MKIPVENNAAVRQFNLPEDAVNDPKAAANADKKPGLGQEAPHISRTDGKAHAAGTSGPGRGLLSEPGPLPPSTIKVDPALLQATTDRLENLHESKTIFDIFAVMALICKVAIEQRKSSKETARFALGVQVKEINNQADKMRKSADEAFKGALTNAIFTIAAGAVTMGMAGASLKFASNQVVAHGLQALGSGGASILQGAGGLGKAEFDKQAAYKQAEGKEHEAKAQIASADRDEALKMRDTMYEHLTSTLAAMRQILQSREQTTAKIFA